MKERTFRRVIGALAILGVMLAAYLVYEHYLPEDNTFCNINATFNCQTVNTSPYALFFGVPVAILGLLYYLGLLGLALFEPKVRRALDLPFQNEALLVLCYALLGFLFTLYLTAIEAFLLKTYCPLCLGSAAIVLVVNALAIGHYRNSRR